MADALWAAEADEWAKARPEVDDAMKAHGKPDLAELEAWAARLREELPGRTPPGLDLDEAVMLVDW
jgi:hypothetical protein